MKEGWTAGQRPKCDDWEGRTIPGKAHKCLAWGGNVLTWGSPEVR